MNSKDQERLDRLRKRCEHLESRIAAEPVRDLSFDKAEASALRWAINFIEGALASERVDV